MRLLSTEDERASSRRKGFLLRQIKTPLHLDLKLYNLPEQTFN